MRLRYSPTTALFFAVFTLFLGVNSGIAEFLCHSSLSFVWKKTQEEAEKEVFWARLERKGIDEAAAKAALEQVIATEKSRALDGCRIDHENLAGCVAGKFSSLAPTLQRLSFTQRKSIEDAVNSDCVSRQGSCSTVKVADPVCSQLVSASSSSSAESKETKKKK